MILQTKSFKEPTWGCESQQASGRGLAAPVDSLQISVKQPLAWLHLSLEFTLAAGLAAEVAARSQSTTCRGEWGRTTEESKSEAEEQ